MPVVSATSWFSSLVMVFYTSTKSSSYLKLLELIRPHCGAEQETLAFQPASSHLLQLCWSSPLALAVGVQWPSDCCHWDVPPEVHLTTCCALLSPGRARRLQPLHLSPPPGVWRRRAHANVPAVRQRHLCQSLCGPSDQSEQMFWWVNIGCCFGVCLHDSSITTALDQMGSLDTLFLTK